MLTVSDILANSSDVGAIKIAMRLGSPKFYDYIRAFGFGSPTGVDLPGESRGILHRLENWGSFSIGSISMGQEVGVTPVQLVTAVSSIANGGLLYRPHVVQEIRRGEQTLPLDIASSAAEPKRSIRPETAATLRRLMEGVILHGTGKLARLDGWTAAGKTGTAQKTDPATGRYSPTKVVASFTGFAPINNPVVTILVSIDSPEGWPHGGGDVAAPVFKRIAEQVLPYMDVARDVPLSPLLLKASYHTQAESDPSALEDFTPVDLSNELENSDTREDQPEQKSPAKSQEVTVAVEEGGDITVPDFTGKTMREVTEVCLKMGLNPILVGTSLASHQTPAAGVKIRRGTKVTVEFGAVAELAAKSR
jgi:membrane peptidoglycan carboxypeptidase